MEGRLPRGFCIKRLTDLPMLWSEQWGAIGPNSADPSRSFPRVANPPCRHRKALSLCLGFSISGPLAHQLGLVLDRPYRHEPLARPPRRLANRRRIDRVVLVAPDIRLHMRGRDQPHLEAERQQLPPPVMRRGAGLHRHHTPRELGEKRGTPTARELCAPPRSRLSRRRREPERQDRRLAEANQFATRLGAHANSEPYLGFVHYSCRLDVEIVELNALHLDHHRQALTENVESISHR